MAIEITFRDFIAASGVLAVSAVLMLGAIAVMAVIEAGHPIQTDQYGDHDNG